MRGGQASCLTLGRQHVRSGVSELQFARRNRHHALVDLSRLPAQITSDGCQSRENKLVFNLERNRPPLLALVRVRAGTPAVPRAFIRWVYRSVRTATHGTVRVRVAAAQVESEPQPAEQTVPRRTLSGQVSGVQVCATHCRCTRPRVPLGALLPPRNQSHWPARGVAYRDSAHAQHGSRHGSSERY